LLILSDEVYDRIVFDRPVAESFARLPGSREHVLVVNSFSKTYSMTGWRLGYALASERLIKSMTKVAEFMTSSAPAMLQQAGITALRDGESFVRETQARYAARRKLVMDGLATMPRLSLAAPAGAFFAFPRVEGLTDSTTFALALLRATGVAVAPGAGFGDGGEGYIRLCFASSERVLAPALERLGGYLTRTR
jgi:aspartate/methionine/tyrosine aminotransferase